MTNRRKIDSEHLKNAKSIPAVAISIPFCSGL